MEGDGKPMGARREITQYLPVVFGLSEAEAAAAIGVSATLFRKLVAEGKMPGPRKVGARRVYDVDELRAAFKSLPKDEEQGQAEAGAADDPWSGVSL